MACSLGHPAEPWERVVPGLYRCLAPVTILVPRPVGPGGAVQPVPTAYPHGEMYYDAAVEPIAFCPCGRCAVTVCAQCRRYRCQFCQPTGGPVCAECAATIEGRVFSQIAYGWRLLAGSTVRESDGHRPGERRPPSGRATASPTPLSCSPPARSCERWLPRNAARA